MLFWLNSDLYHVANPQYIPTFVLKVQPDELCILQCICTMVIASIKNCNHHSRRKLFFCFFFQIPLPRKSNWLCITSCYHHVSHTHLNEELANAILGLVPQGFIMYCLSTSPLSNCFVWLFYFFIMHCKHYLNWLKLNTHVRGNTRQCWRM
jgi:hypothetical protein